METILCRQVLYQLVGFPSSDIRLKSSSDNGEPTFHITASFEDETLKKSAERFFEFGQYYLNIKEYIRRNQSHKSGLVNHALCAALNNLLEDYLMFVSQLEDRMGNSPYGLGSMWTLCQPTFMRLKLISQLVSDLQRAKEDQNIKGSQILDLIYQHLTRYAGDPKARQLFQHLLNKSAKPFVRQMIDWVRTGTLEDAYDEFFICRKSSVVAGRPPSDALVDWWWKTGFQLSASVPVPTFLMDDLAGKILATGKYWHVLLACGKQQLALESLSGVSEPSVELNDIFQLSSLVQSAHQMANKSVLTSLFHEFDLLPKLRWMKHYFFLSQSDFLQEFLDNSLNLLRLPSNQISAVKLQSILELAIKTSSSLPSVDVHCGYLPNNASVNRQPLEDQIKVQLSKYAFVDMLVKIISGNDLADLSISGDSETLTADGVSDSQSSSSSRMTGLYTLTLDVDIPFPLSLIISRRAVTKYQLIFRQLFVLKAVENLLKSAWMDHQISARLFARWSPKEQSREADASVVRLERCLRMAWTLRARMCSLIQGMLSFVCDRLESKYHVFSEWLLRLRYATLNTDGNAAGNKYELDSVDDLIVKHDQYLDACLKECLITNKKLVLIQHQIFSTCTSFSQQTERFLKSYLMDPSIVFTSTAAANSSTDSKSPLDVYIHVVDKCQTQYNDILRSFQQALTLIADAEGDGWVQEIMVRIGLSI